MERGVGGQSHKTPHFHLRHRYPPPGMTHPRAWYRLNRLHTGVGRFRSCLYKWGMASFAACECGAEEQIVNHVVLQCPVHQPPHEPHGLTVLDNETTEWLLSPRDLVRPSSGLKNWLKRRRICRQHLFFSKPKIRGLNLPQITPKCAVISSCSMKRNNRTWHSVSKKIKKLCSNYKLLYKLLYTSLNCRAGQSLVGLRSRIAPTMLFFHNNTPFPGFFLLARTVQSYSGNHNYHKHSLYSLGAHFWICRMSVQNWPVLSQVSCLFDGSLESKGSSENRNAIWKTCNSRL